MALERANSLKAYYSYGEGPIVIVYSGTIPDASYLVLCTISLLWFPSAQC